MKPICVLAVLALLVTACGMPVSETTTTSTVPATEPKTNPLAQLEKARQQWDAIGLTSYRFRFEDDCGECDPAQRRPRDVVVWNGSTHGAGQPTVETLFEQIDEAIQAGRTVEVDYHAELGHPIEISIDMESRAYDGGTHWLVSDLDRGLPGGDVSLEALEDARQRWDRLRPPAYELQTTIGCDCPLAGTISARVNGDRLIDWEIDLVDGDSQVSAITVDDMFDDLHEMLSAGDGLVEDGVRFSGSAEYHPELGYPMWVGLDIEILDPTSYLAHLPERLVFSIQHFEPLESAEPSPLDVLAEARERWTALEYADYQFRLTLHDVEDASFSEPHTVVIEDGDIVPVDRGEQPLDGADAPFMSVDDLFDLIEGHTDSGNVVEVLYHDTLGYPVFAAVIDEESKEQILAFSIDGLVQTR